MNRRLLTALAGLIVLGGIGYGIHAWVYSLHHVTTDDAYVESTISPLSAKVAGHVAELRVDDNQSVKAGDLLLRIDPRDYEAKRDQSRADRLRSGAGSCSCETWPSRPPWARPSQASGRRPGAALRHRFP